MAEHQGSGEHGSTTAHDAESVRRLIAVVFSHDDLQRVRDHLGGARTAMLGPLLRAGQYEQEESEWLRCRVRETVVGARLVLAGPRTEVLAARTDALRAGMVPEEILLLERPDRLEKVYCPHCRTLTRAQDPLRRSVRCCGCDRDLEVFAHFSRGLSAWLGVAAGAEEPVP